jgi:hypothetical protein
MIHYQPTELTRGTAMVRFRIVVILASIATLIYTIGAPHIGGG